MRTLKDKFTSRKFLMALVGIVTGIGIIVAGNTTEGIITVITSMISYLVTEGYVDIQSVKNIAESIANNVEEKND